MKTKLLLLLILVFPVSAQEPEGILISPAERQALIERFGAMQEYIEKLEKGLKICLQVQRS